LAVSVQDVVDQVSQVSYTHYLSDDNFLYTHNGDNRGYGPQHDLARTNIYNTFESFGLSTSLDPFVYASQTFYNVVAVHSGLVNPSQIYLVGAHYDSVNNPGADDNASGTAGVLELARVLSRYPFESTVVFVAFDREEDGLRGSAAYAAEHAADNILGMISMDMIAHSGSDPTHARVYTGGGSLNTANDLIAALGMYSATLPGDKVNGLYFGAAGNSDHAPFAGFPNGSALVIESDFSPYYHGPNDSVDTLNYIDYAYATKLTRGVAGYLAEHAVLIAAAAVPEPSGWVLAMIAVCGLAMVGRRS
jgi:Zn-dependent M28 family amino/carboxypeptidase